MRFFGKDAFNGSFIYQATHLFIKRVTGLLKAALFLIHLARIWMKLLSSTWIFTESPAFVFQVWYFGSCQEIKEQKVLNELAASFAM